MVRSLYAAFLTLGGIVSPADAQTSPAVLTERGREFTIDAQVVGATFGVATRVQPLLLVGAEAGLLGDFLTYTRLSGGPPVRLRRRAAGEALIYELFHYSVFARLEPRGGFQIDAGIRGSRAFFDRMASEDADVIDFTGVYFSPTWGSRHLKVGLRVQAGHYRDPVVGTNWSGWAVAPFTVRVVLP